MNVKQQNPSTSQRCRDYAWRRLDIRHSAARRPFVIRFYNQEGIAKNINYRDKSTLQSVVTGRTRWKR